jgi:serine/threonine protein kinase
MWLARSGDRTRVKLTQFVVGDAPSFAPTHAAPEHFKSSYGPIAPATDVFGLALAFVEVVSGRRPFEGIDPADETALYLATSDIKKRPTLRAVGVATSDAIEAVLQSALAVDPKRRPPDAKAFWDALLAAVPELSPATASVRPGPQAPIVIDAPKDDDRSAMLAWIAVAFVAAAAAAIVAAKVMASGH